MRCCHRLEDARCCRERESAAHFHRGTADVWDVAKFSPADAKPEGVGGRLFSSGVGTVYGVQ